MGFEAGAITVQLQLSKEQWNAALKSVSEDQKKIAEESKTHSKGIVESVEAIAKSWIGVGTAVVGALTALTVKAASYGSEMQHAYEKTGIAVETLGGLRLSAEKAEIGMGGLVNGLKVLSKFSEAATDASSQQAATMKRLGVELIDSTGKAKPLTDQLFQMADVFQKMPAGPEKAALAMEVFGRAGMDMIPLLNMGSAGLKENWKHAERLGQVMSGPTAEAMEEFEDSMVELKAAGLGLTVAVGQALMPAIKGIAVAVTDVVVAIRKWVEAHPGLFQAITNLTESVKWFVGAVKDAAEWVEKWIEIMNPLAKVHAAAMREMMRAEAEFQKQQDEGRRAWLERHEKIYGKTKELAHLNIELSDAVAKANRAAVDAINKATMDEYNYAVWSINQKYNVQKAELEKERADKNSFALNEKARQAELTAAWKTESEKRATAQKTSDAKELQASKEKWVEYGRNLSQAFRDAFKQKKDAEDKSYKETEMMWKFFAQGFAHVYKEGQDSAKKIETAFQKSMKKINGFVQDMQQVFNRYFQMLQAKSDAYYQREFANLDKLYQKKKDELAKSYNAKIAELDQRDAAEALSKQKQSIMLSNMTAEEKAAALADLDTEQRKIDERKKIDEEYAAAQTKIEEEQAAKKRLLERQQAEAIKKSSIAEAYINMGTAITASFAALGWPLGIFAAAAAGVACLFQINAIKSQPLPALARGGLQMNPTITQFAEEGPEAAIPLPELKEMLGVGRGGRRQNLVFNFSIRAFDSKDVIRATRETIIPEIKRAMGRESFRVPGHAVG